MELTLHKQHHALSSEAKLGVRPLQPHANADDTLQSSFKLNYQSSANKVYSKLASE